MEFKLWLDRLVVWSIKNHWMFLITMVGVQYLTGTSLATGSEPLGINFGIVRVVHYWNGRLIGFLALILLVEKGYLWLKKRGAI